MKKRRERESVMSEETFVCTACPGWGDHEYCALKTVVKDGKILRTEQLDYTGPESEEGYICQKGVAAARQPYNPDRVQGPMKRVGKRGEGKWERISWDQALIKTPASPSITPSQLKHVDQRDHSQPRADCRFRHLAVRRGRVPRQGCWGSGARYACSSISTIRPSRHSTRRPPWCA